MSRRSLDDLNAALSKAVERLRRDALTIVTYDDPTKPWLSESYWREAHEEANRLLDLAEHMRMRKVHRVYEDEALAKRSVEDAMAEWDTELPKLQGNDVRMLDEGWGRRTMGQAMRTGWDMLHAPFAGEPQPSFDFQCHQCGKPITDHKGRWTDHAGKTVCDLTLVDPIDVETESYWTDHQPMPWHPEGEEDENDDDDE